MFSGKSFLIFMLIGPIIGALGAGVGLQERALLPVYIVGGYFAAITWLGYSVLFKILDSLTTKYSFVETVFFESFAFIWGALFASISGLAIFSLVVCGSGSWLFGGNFNCVIHIFKNQWGMIIIPAIICGSFSTMFLDDGRLIH